MCNYISEEEFKSRVSKNLKTIMKDRGINQVELSKRTGIPQPMISHYVSGKADPGFFKMDKIAKVLDCSIDEITGRYTKENL